MSDSRTRNYTLTKIGGKWTTLDGVITLTPEPTIHLTQPCEGSIRNIMVTPMRAHFCRKLTCSGGGSSADMTIHSSFSYDYYLGSYREHIEESQWKKISFDVVSIRDEGVKYAPWCQECVDGKDVYYLWDIILGGAIKDVPCEDGWATGWGGGWEVSGSVAHPGDETSEAWGYKNIRMKITSVEAEVSYSRTGKIVRDPDDETKLISSDGNIVVDTFAS